VTFSYTKRAYSRRSVRVKQ